MIASPLSWLLACLSLVIALRELGIPRWSYTNPFTHHRKDVAIGLQDEARRPSERAQMNSKNFYWASH